MPGGPPGVRLCQQVERSEPSRSIRGVGYAAVQSATMPHQRIHHRIGAAQQLQAAEAAAFRCLQMASVDGLRQEVHWPPAARMPAVSPRGLHEQLHRQVAVPPEKFQLVCARTGAPREDHGIRASRAGDNRAPRARVASAAPTALRRSRTAFAAGAASNRAPRAAPGATSDTSTALRQDTTAFAAGAANNRAPWTASGVVSAAPAALR